MRHGALFESFTEKGNEMRAGFESFTEKQGDERENDEAEMRAT